MAFKAFTQTCVYEKHTVLKEKGKSSIQCIEICDRNVYMGTKDGTVQHLVLQNGGGSKIKEGMAKKLSPSNQVVQLRTVPLFNHLLVLWDQSIISLNMFSVEPVPALKKIKNVSLFEVGNSSVNSEYVEMVTSSSRRRLIRIHMVGVDRWEVVKEVPLFQEPVAMAVDGSTLCLATSDRYLLFDTTTGGSQELFPYTQSKQRVFVTSAGQGEFLLNGPESLGMFVMKTGVCQRPPLQWPHEVQAARLCFPYILTLQPQELSVYSVLDQQLKQTVSLSGAKGLLLTSDGVLVFTERDIFSLCLVPFEEQIQALVRLDRVKEAVVLLEGVQEYHPLDSFKELQMAVICLAGFAHYFQQSFSEAKDLFIKGELDPREIIHLYPDVQPVLGDGFQSQFDQANMVRDLQVLWQEDGNAYHHYLLFVVDFLSAVRGTQQGLRCSEEVDSALLRLYVALGDNENLQELLDFPNDCKQDHCVPFLEQHNRFYALGFLYQSHGNHNDALKTWMKIVDGIYKDPSCSDVYGHIVRTLSKLPDIDAVWKFSDWTLQKNQKTGVQVFTRRPPDALLQTQDVLAFLEKYPLALRLYLHFLVLDLKSEEERHHSRLALAYVTHALQEEEEADSMEARERLQQLLWESEFFDVSVVYDKVKSTTLHMEKAILLCRAGEHSQALQVLVHQGQDHQAAEAFCCKAAPDKDSQLRQTLMLALFQIYLSSRDLSVSALDLLNHNPQVFAAEKVIQLLPESWSIQLLSEFLIGSLRATFHQRRMAKLQMALSQAELMRHKVIWMKTSETKFRLDSEQKCKVCQKNLAEPQFACNLSGDLIHVKCAGF